ncbi:MAG: rRNA maturation RNase YbeY [Ornithinimicrobium sp.]
MSIDILNESGEAPAAVTEEELRALATYVLTELNVNPRAELAVTLLDEKAMEALHRQWMDLPGPTDVMSFPMDELRPGGGEDGSADGVLGDVVLCPAVARRQAAGSGHSTADELLLLLTHGVLHLLGFDHAEQEQEKEMFDLQRTLLLTYLAGRGRSTTAAPVPQLGTTS